MTKPEKAMLRSAISILSKREEPLPYRELLSQVYMELVEKRVQFDSARQIETTLLSHTGRELILTEESPDDQGFKTTKKWALGQEWIPEERNRRGTLFAKLSSHRPSVSPVMRLLKKWQRKPKYHPKQSAEDDDAGPQ